MPRAYFGHNRRVYTLPRIFDMDLTQFSTPELKDLLNQLPKEIERREKVEKAELRKELEAKAMAAGYTLAELVRATRTVTADVQYKYRHPADPSLKWAGRGKRPRWVIDFLGSGGSLAQLQG